MWEINSTAQLFNTLAALCFGIIVSLAYDIIRALRKAYNYSALSVFLQDVGFSFLVAISVFTFLLSTTNGELRGYVIMALSGGFIISRLTISVLWYKALRFTFTRFNKMTMHISKLFYRFFDILERKGQKILEKILKWLKKLLK